MEPKMKYKTSRSFKICLSQESCQYTNTYLRPIKILHVLTSNVAVAGNQRETGD
jgi:hypothetical protein